MQTDLKYLLHSSDIIALSNGTIFAKKCWFFCKKDADISKIKTGLVLKRLFSETAYVSCTWKQAPKKPTQIRVKN